MDRINFHTDTGTIFYIVFTRVSGFPFITLKSTIPLYNYIETNTIVIFHHIVQVHTTFRWININGILNINIVVLFMRPRIKTENIRRAYKYAYG